MTTLESQLEAAALARGMTTDELAAEFARRFDDLVDKVVLDQHAETQLHHIRETTTARVAADAAWRSAVVEAGLLGIARSEIARAAGVSRQWVTQMISNATDTNDGE
ncbi:MAG: hypothetical protein NVV66_16335 [Cellulomonas sp.]|uniref:hypothetical protein n=1 Tax=Cellulomonas sp. TaxID=40001 RepID=UPI002585BD25|nr:hypothetical protein [Cellulomonas sp.]MCR6706185.1 hypothetical protein [Cellulomonas sp.]